MIYSDHVAKLKALWMLARRHEDEYIQIYRELAGKAPEIEGQLPMWASVELPGLMEALTGDVEGEQDVDQ